MAKRIIILIISGLLLQSCAFLFYNYRGYLITEFSIANINADTKVRQQAGELIFRLAGKEDFYTHFTTATYDSLYFYGPDYHHFYFKIYEDSLTTKIFLRYSGYNGFRNRPPRKQFIQSLTDSLKSKFGATQIIFKDISNEKKKN
jgi:hypothetical protein